MSQFATVLTALDLTEMDEKLIAYSKFIAAQFGARKVYFIHIVPDFKAPKALQVEFHKRFAPETPLDEVVRKKMHESIAPVFADAPHLNFEIEVVEGKPFQQLAHWAEIKNADLVIVGKKAVSDRSGITATRVVRGIKKTAVLYVTRDTGEHFDKILVPVDFSDNSARALKTALALRLKNQPSKVTAAYIVDYPPTGYYLNHQEYQGFNQMLMDTAKASFEEFLHKNEINERDIELKVLENAWYNIAGAISDYAASGKFNLIVMGAQGHTPLESLVFGSVTEKVVNYIRQVPVMVVR